jgi:putative colanic acid biosynthesis acetyltransferase WcaF
MPVRVDLSKSKTHWPWPIMVRRVLWQGFFSYCARFLPRPLNPLRILILRAAGANIGKHCKIMPGVRVLIPWNLVLDDWVTIGRNVEFLNHGKIHIRSMSAISQYCFLCTSSHDYRDPTMPLIYSDIEIGSECWIAADVFVGPGVKIGDGCVIGARSVVSRDMPAWMVCAGNPCHALKARELKAEHPAR